MYDTHCTILNEIGQCAYFASNMIVIFASNPPIRVRIPPDPKKISNSYFFHNFHINTLPIMHTRCSIRNCGLVFISCIFRQLCCVILKLFTCGGKYCSTRASLRLALVLQYFPPHVNNFIITLAKS